MSVRVSTNKRWGFLEVDIRVRLPDGTRYRERTKAPVQSRSGARRWGEERERFLALHGSVQPKKEVVTVAEFKPRFMDGYAKANRLKASGIAHKEAYLRLYVLPLLGAKRLDAITDEDIQRLKARMERKNAKTVNNALSVLSKMLKVAVEWKKIDRLPAAIRLLKPGTSEMAFYEEEDYERLVEAAAQVDERALIAVLIGGDAGLRTGEIIALEWTDIDFRRSLLHVNRAEWEGHIGTPKGGRARTVNMTSRLAAALKAHRHLKGPRVLYSDDKSTADRDVLSSWIKRAERRAGLPITGRLHILRHTFCSRLAIRGATTKAIQELAGHASLTTTQRYMHLSPAAKESAIRLLEFGVRGEKRGEIGESGAASEENRR